MKHRSQLTPQQPQAQPQAPAEPISRRQEVRNTIGQLYLLIQALARTIYQMELKDEQIRELAQKMLKTLATTIGDITNERVKQLAGEFLIVEALRREGYKKSFGKNSRITWQVNPRLKVSAKITNIRLAAGKPFFTISPEDSAVVKYRVPRSVTGVMSHEITEKP